MPFASRPLVPALAALVAAALILTPRPARADKVAHMVSPGLDFSLSIGDKLAFGIGLDVRYTTVFTGTGDCGHDRRTGLGFFGRASLLNFKAGRFAAGLHGGGEPSRPIVSAEGEVGWTYRTALDDTHPGAHGLHVGAAATVYPGVEFSIRGSLPLLEPRVKSEVTFGLGARVPGPFGMPTSTYCAVL